MGANIQRKTWIRAESLLIGLTGATVEVSLTDVPIRGWIRRARLQTATAGPPTLTLEVRQAAGGTALVVTLAYSATAAPLDQEEDTGVFYSIPAGTTSPQRGTLFVAVSSSVNPDTVNLSLDIEPAI